MNEFNRKARQHQKHLAVWMLAALFAFVLHPIGSGLFCHEDFGHDHATHASDHHHELDNDHHDAGESHHNFNQPSHHKPEENCCCVGNDAPAIAVWATSYSTSPHQRGVLTPLSAVLPQALVPQGAITIQSRAGPAAPSVISQLRRSSLLDRAPPLSI